MHPPPDRPKIYHITHGKNLAGIIKDDRLWSDAEMTNRGGPNASVGISEIKQRRLRKQAVGFDADMTVGHFVPFNFCPRSIMLYILHRKNHPGLSYRDGQRPILHLEADLRDVIVWCESQGRPWAFTDCNAGSGYSNSFRSLKQLDQLDWESILSNDFREVRVKEAKQAEFLVLESFPWSLVRTIGVINDAIANRVREIVSVSDHQVDVRVERTWYF